ncbi:uncharacterized protein LOC134293146 [Anolis carolinensis]|uniref:uncharacterized protein LOC134293146 n=1 Tax=Anolis carolinensis TaxID=28377 RepID=UPI002F2B1D31
MFVMTRLRMLLRKHYVPFSAALLLIFVGASWPCPPACRICTIYEAQCEHFSSLQAVLGGLSSYTKKILLMNGNLTEIPPLSFAKFPLLHFLSITRSPVSSLSDFAFFSMHLNGLRILNLSNNHLFSCAIEPMAFTGLPFLQELILANNSLDIVRRFWFLEMPALLRLHLGANQIAYLPPRTFQNLTKLSELVVSSNLIQYLSMDTFYGVSLLTKLDLSNNRILFIHHEVFQPLQALRHLVLFGNRLTVLPILPSSISFLFLHENPWLCTCELFSSMGPFLEKIQFPDGVTCDGPPSLAGLQVADFRSEECSSPSLAKSSSSSSLSAFSSSSSTTTSTQVGSTMFWNLSFLYGFLAGIFTSLVICLVFCCCCFCRYRQRWNFPRFACKTESKETHQAKTAQSLSSEKRPLDSNPQALCSFPVVQNTAASLDAGCVARRLSSGGQAEPMGCPPPKPLVAVLSTDAAGQSVVSLHEDGKEAVVQTISASLDSGCVARQTSSGFQAEPMGCSSPKPLVAVLSTDTAGQSVVSPHEDAKEAVVQTISASLDSGCVARQTSSGFQAEPMGCSSPKPLVAVLSTDTAGQSVVSPHEDAKEAVVQTISASLDSGCVARQTSSGFQAEPMGCPSPKPLAAVLSMDAAGQSVMSLHEDGKEAGSPVLDQLCCQVYGGDNREHEATTSKERVDHAAAHMNSHSSEQQSSAKRTHEWYDLHLQQAASSQAERQYCALEKSVNSQASRPEIQPGVLQCPQVLVHINVPKESAQKIERHRDFVALEKPANGQSSHREIQPGGLQCSQVVVHINVPDESAQKIERHQDWVYERTECHRSRLRFHPSRRWSSKRKRSSSIWRPSHRHMACFVSPRSKKTSHMKVCQKGLLGRRHPKHVATWKSDLYADISLLASKVNMIQAWTSLHRYGSHPPSTTPYASSISSMSSLNEENSCLRERHHKCPRCGCEKPSARLIPQGTWVPWDTAPRTSKWPLDVASQQSSTDTIHRKDREMALACLGLDENTEKSPLQELEAESTYKKVSLLMISTTQPPLNNEDERMAILETGETRSLGDHHPVDTSSSRSTISGGEIQDAEGSVDTNSFDQPLREGAKAPPPSEDSDVTLSESCYDFSKSHLFRIEAHLSMKETSISSKSHREMLESDLQGDGCEEINAATTTTTTSWRPEVQKIQIKLPDRRGKIKQRTRKH